MFKLHPPMMTSVLDYSSLLMAFSFAGGRRSSVCPRAALDYFPRVEVGYGSQAWCLMLISIFCSSTQAALEPGAREKWPVVFSVVWSWEVFHMQGFQDLTWLDFD
jgi:hypothetical protein